MSGFEITISGIADVNRVLREIAPKEAKNLLRATVFDLARDLANTAAGSMPQEQGDMKGATRAKRERGNRDTVAASVIVGKEAFYWRYLEYGQGPDGVEYAMFLNALQALQPDLDRKYLEIFTAKLIARLARLAKRAGRE